MAHFVRNQAGWNDMTRNPNGLIGSYMRRKGEILQGLAKQQVGKRTYALQRSIYHRTWYGGTGWIVRVGSDNPISYVHHEGTKPYTIYPKSAKALRFNSHGKIVYARIVHHPGTKPNRYLSDNLRQVI